MSPQLLIGTSPSGLLCRIYNLSPPSPPPDFGFPSGQGIKYQFTLAIIIVYFSSTKRANIKYKITIFRV
jgi:hypothetical protein